MKSIYSVKIKPFIKRNLPFVKYRWRIHSYFKNINVRHLLYYNIKGWRVQCDLSHDIITNKNRELEIKTIDESSRDAFREFVKKNSEELVYKNWIIYEYGKHNGFIALINGKIIGNLLWWANDIDMKPPAEVIFSNTKIEKGEVFGFNFLISPKYRGQRNAITFFSKVNSELKKQGYNRMTGLVDDCNLPARWTYMAIGFKDIKLLKTHIFFNLIVYLEKALFIKTRYWHPGMDFACRMLLSFRR